MRIFILEDDTQRLAVLTRILDKCLVPGDQVHIATDIDSAGYLFDGHYDLLLLDHDLGGRQMVDSLEEGTGYQFLLRYRDRIKDCAAIVHSWNPEGAWMMMRLLYECPLVNAYRIAFSPQVFEGLIPTMVTRIRQVLDEKAGVRAA